MYICGLHIMCTLFIAIKQNRPFTDETINSCQQLFFIDNYVWSTIYILCYFCALTHQTVCGR